MNLKIWILGTIAMATSSLAKAQNFNSTGESSQLGNISVGLRGSFTASKLSQLQLGQNILPAMQFAGAGGAAVFVEMPITNHFSFQPEFDFTQKGVKVQEGISTATTFGGIDLPLNAKFKIRTFYLDMPLLAKYHFGDVNKLHGYAMLGPSVGYLADASMRITLLNIFPFNSNFPKSVFKDFEFSGVAALGFEAPVSNRMKFFAEGRYQHGFTRILNTGWLKLPVRNETVGFGMGLKLSI